LSLVLFCLIADYGPFLFLVDITSNCHGLFRTLLDVFVIYKIYYVANYILLTVFFTLSRSLMFIFLDVSWVCLRYVLLQWLDFLGSLLHSLSVCLLLHGITLTPEGLLHTLKSRQLKS